ncbi:DUF4811 domain-containing protein [Weissella viridescens]|uniref:DUF4811 domain-containing protein n=1 Tax=Weissella viridescens TaxID=1629 RepID=A0A3P2RFX5_WEIVI|nr:DUF4811 domain-containing protein [Weissella viridescens]RRG18516.1 DUF4811 domain-containing protein [Weissella viridescens]
MIVLLVLGIVFLLYALLQYVQHHSIRWIPIVIGVVLIGLNTWGLKVDDQDHLFMTKRSDSTTEKIKPAEELGSYKFITTEKVDGGKRYTYDMGDKTYQTLAEGTKMTLKTGSPATLKTNLTTYQTDNAFDRFMRMGQNQKTGTKTSYVMTIPKDWHVLTTSQYQQLADLNKNSDKTISDAVAKQVKVEFAKQYKQNPNFLKNKKAQKAVQEKVVQTETQKYNAALNAQISQKLKDWHVK